MSDDESAGEADDEWRFSVDEFEDSPNGDGDAPADGSPTRVGAGERTPPGENDATVAGEFTPKVPVVPETPNAESAVFVTIGAVLTVIALGALVGGATFGMFDALTIVVVVAALGAATYVVLVRLTPDT